MPNRKATRRWFYILQKLSHNHYPSKSDLKEYLEGVDFSFSNRTLERDIEALRTDYGISIEYSSPRNGYFINREHGNIQLEALLRFLDLINSAELLSSNVAERKEIIDCISFDKSDDLQGIEYLQSLLKAVIENQKICFDYQKYYKEVPDSVSLEPYHLKEYQKRWYVVGINDSGDLRTYGIDRINNLKLMDQNFKVNPDIDVKEKFASTIGLNFSSEKPQIIKLTFTPFQGKYIKSLKLHDSQKIIQDDEDALVVELFVTPNFELEQRILMYAANVKVLEPKWLAEKMQAHYKEALNRYS